MFPFLGKKNQKIIIMRLLMWMILHRLLQPILRCLLRRILRRPLLLLRNPLLIVLLAVEVEVLPAIVVVLHPRPKKVILECGVDRRIMPMCPPITAWNLEVTV